MIWLHTLRMMHAKQVKFGQNKKLQPTGCLFFMIFFFFNLAAFWFDHVLSQPFVLQFTLVCVCVGDIQRSVCSSLCTPVCRSVDWRRARALKLSGQRWKVASRRRRARSPAVADRMFLKFSTSGTSAVALYVMVPWYQFHLALVSPLRSGSDQPLTGSMASGVELALSSVRVALMMLSVCSGDSLSNQGKTHWHTHAQRSARSLVCTTDWSVCIWFL